MSEDVRIPVSLRRPARVTDRWQRGGAGVTLTTDAFDQQADGWLWPGPLTEETRDVFWHVVKASRCVVLEFMNPAVLGLVWFGGVPVVAYDAAEVRRIMTSVRAVSTAKEEGHAEEVDERRMAALLITDWEERTPVFRVG